LTGAEIAITDLSQAPVVVLMVENPHRHSLYQEKRAINAAIDRGATNEWRLMSNQHGNCRDFNLKAVIG
jgi:hypothetical protein